MRIAGRVWKLGDDVGATDLIPARYDKIGMKRDWAECAHHLLEDLEPSFASGVRRGDIIVAGTNFGSGHAHYFGAVINACKHVGLGAAFATSINGMFFRAATDLGLMTWTYPELADEVSTGDEIDVDLREGRFENRTRNTCRLLTPPHPLILAIFDAGGSTNWAIQRARRTTAQPG
jgi:3-isopropylmalate/(R)-2-methylmalate dehydratase small subunit